MSSQEGRHAGISIWITPMGSHIHNGTAEQYDYRTSRSAELRRRNRRVGLIVAIVAIVLVIFTFIYVTWFGGVNIGPQAPLHSMLGSIPPGGGIA